ncbi:MAG: intradiol ring-cleavage dioxygenase, partial [Cyclobacteriaceae bacterium]|nr:intradiol ring-cleavage dioxygenase [Cyclobacteriaceae bacterium]
NTHHGHIRGWVKTDGSGAYRIYTSRPAPYPSANEPAHIHVLIKEPKLANEYYIDDLIFDDDVRVLKKKRSGWVPENRGGSGLLRVVLSGKTQIAEHNVVLGLNIPNYPSQDEAGPASGLKIGEEQPSFTSFHAWGSDRGTQTCPVCKYGRYHGIVYFVGNRPDWTEIKAWLTFLETESTSQSKYLKAYFVYANDRGFDRVARQKELEQLGRMLNIKNTALTFVPSCDDKASDMYLNRINPAVENTLVIYRHRVIIDKFINVKPTAATFEIVRERINATKSEYADLPEPTH